MQRFALIAAFGLALARAASAQTASQYNQLKQQLDTLQKQVEGLKAAGPEAIPTEAAPKKLEWTGFGEMAYQNMGTRQENGSPSPYRDIANVTRLCVAGIYHYDEKIQAKFEVELLNAGANALTTNSLNKNISIDVDQAYVEDKFTEQAGLRAGLMIVPMGLTNDHYRPTDYDGVFRPSVETYLIPSTWRELGAGLFGTLGPNKMVSYRSYVVNGLNAVGAETIWGNNTFNQVPGFSGSQGIMGGRSLGTISLATDGAWVTRVDVALMKNSFLGAAYYVGKAGQGLVPSEIPIEIWEAHAHLEYQNARLQALFTQGNMANAGQLDDMIVATANAAHTPPDLVGGRWWGGYVSLDYNVMPLFKPEGMKGIAHLGPYFRYERYVTASHMPSFYWADPANSRTEYTVGLSVKPIKNIIVKGEYQWLNNEARGVGSPALVENGQLPLTGVHEWNLGLGFEF